MTRDEVQVKVVEILERLMAAEPESISLNDSLEYDVGADSLDLVEFLLDIEEEFAIEISDEEAEKVKTVLEAVDLVWRSVA